MPLDNLRVLPRKKPLSQEDTNMLLLALVEEMTGIMQERAKLLEDMTAQRDKSMQEGFTDLENTITIYPSDTWREVIIKARILRDLGRTEDAIAAFQMSAEMFADAELQASEYARMAIRFTQYLPELSIQGGEYVQNFTVESNIQKAGLLVGDILIALQNKPITGLDGLLLKIMPNTPVSIEALRWDASAARFHHLSINIPSKPLGGHFYPI